jgi:hypothetical protein
MIRELFALTPIYFYAKGTFEMLIMKFNSLFGVSKIIWNLLVVEALTIARLWFPVKQNRILIPELFTPPIC